MTFSFTFQALCNLYMTMYVEYLECSLYYDTVSIPRQTMLLSCI